MITLDLTDILADLEPVPPMATQEEQLTLFDHQEEAVNKIVSTLKENRGFSLNDDMGLGKTITSLESIKRLYSENDKAVSLLVVPKAVLNNWVTEISRVYEEGEYDTLFYQGTSRCEQLKLFLSSPAKYLFVICTAHSLSGDISNFWKTYQGDTMEKFVEIRENTAYSYRINWDMLVVDESHQLRNPTTKIFQCVNAIPRKKTLLLTGTPFNNHTMDLATQSILMNCPVPHCDTSRYQTYTPRLKMVLCSSSINWQSMDVEEYRRDQKKKEYSLLAFHKTLLGSYNKHRELKASGGIYMRRLPLIKRHFRELLQIVDTKEQKKWSNQYKIWMKDCLSLAEEIYSGAERKNLMLDILKHLYRFEKFEYLPEIVVHPVEGFDNVLFRRNLVNQWRCFWKSGEEARANPTFGVLSSEFTEKFTIRRVKSDVEQIRDMIPDMDIDVVTCYLSAQESKVHEDYVDEYRQKWSDFNEVNLINGTRGSSMGALMALLVQWRQHVNCAALVGGVNGKIVITRDGTDITMGLKGILKERYTRELTGQGISQKGVSRLTLPEAEFLDLRGCDTEEKVLARMLQGKKPHLEVDMMSSKIKYILNYVDEYKQRGEKIIVFSSWTTFLMIVREHLHSVYGKPEGLLIHGGQTLTKRNELVDMFQIDDLYSVLLGSVKACGVGLNLTSATRIIFCEPTWNPFGEELQAMQRIHRIGQTKNTSTIYLRTKVLIPKGNRFDLMQMIAQRADFEPGVDHPEGLYRYRDSIDHFVSGLQDTKILTAKRVLGNEFLSEEYRERARDKPNKGKLERLSGLINIARKN